MTNTPEKLIAELQENGDEYLTPEQAIKALKDIGYYEPGQVVNDGSMWLVNGYRGVGLSKRIGVVPDQDWIESLKNINLILKAHRYNQTRAWIDRQKSLLNKKLEIAWSDRNVDEHKACKIALRKIEEFEAILEGEQ